MKKTLIAVVGAVLLVTTLCLVACKKTKLVPGDSTMLYDPSDMEIVKNLDSYDVIMQAYDNWKNASKYSVTIDFDFQGNALGDIYQNSYQQFVKNGDEFYDFYMVAGEGTGADDKDKQKSHKFYTNGSTTKAIYINGDKKKVFLNDDKVVQSNYDGLSWGAFDAKQEDAGISTPADRVNKLTKQLYVYYDAKKYLSDKMDRQVYKDGDKYYCTMIVNTIGMTKDNGLWQDKVVEAIEDATEGKFEKFNEDTRFVYELEKVGNSFRFKQLILMEDYTGNRFGLVDINASQKYWHKFAYDDNSTNIAQYIK